MSDDGCVTLMHHFTEKELGIILMDPTREVATKTTLELIKIQSTMPSRKAKKQSLLLSRESSSRNPTTSAAAVEFCPSHYYSKLVNIILKSPSLSLKIRIAIKPNVDKSRDLKNSLNIGVDICAQLIAVSCCCCLSALFIREL